MNELALFAGAGGGILGGQLLGWHTVCAVEINAYAASVLCARQNDGVLPPFPIWDDVCTFDGKRWKGVIDVISGGFPCQDISDLGKRAGITGARSGLWKEFARIIGEVQPRFAYIENSPSLKTRGLDAVLQDLTDLGYDAKWGIVSARSAGAPHLRKRIWIVAYTNCTRFQKTRAKEQTKRLIKYIPCRVWKSEPNVGRVAHGVAARVDRLKAIGNGQVPAVAAMAWGLLTRDELN